MEGVWQVGHHAYHHPSEDGPGVEGVRQAGHRMGGRIEAVGQPGALQQPVRQRPGWGERTA